MVVVGTLSKTYNFNDMRFRKFTKLAFPVWTRVPGTPFTLPGSGTYTERLPGMEGWVSRDVVERVSKALARNEDLNDIVKAEGGHGGLSTVGKGVGAGGVIGLLGSRLVTGKEKFSPLKNIIEEGLTSRSLKNLKRLPRAVKTMPIAGAALGGLGMLADWTSNRNKREADAGQVSRGLLAEKILQHRALEEAVKSPRPYVNSILRGVPITSASSPPPYVTMPGGVNG